MTALPLIDMPQHLIIFPRVHVGEPLPLVRATVYTFARFPWPSRLRVRVHGHTPHC